MEPQRCSDWSHTPRADGRIVSVSMSRLPNGATAATFTDVTDLERFQAMQRKAVHAAA
jgi:hypothetical protein